MFMYLFIKLSHFDINEIQVIIYNSVIERTQNINLYLNSSFDSAGFLLTA